MGNAIKNVLIVALLIAGIWGLHGMDMQYYTIADNYLFDVNLMISFLSFLIIGAIGVCHD